MKTQLCWMTTELTAGCVRDHTSTPVPAMHPRSLRTSAECVSSESSATLMFRFLMPAKDSSRVRRSLVREAVGLRIHGSHAGLIIQVKHRAEHMRIILSNISERS